MSQCEPARLRELRTGKKKGRQSKGSAVAWRGVACRQTTRARVGRRFPPLPALSALLAPSFHYGVRFALRASTGLTTDSESSQARASGSAPARIRPPGRCFYIQQNDEQGVQGEPAPEWRGSGAAPYALFPCWGRPAGRGAAMGQPATGPAGCSGFTAQPCAYGLRRACAARALRHSPFQTFRAAPP